MIDGWAPIIEEFFKRARIAFTRGKFRIQDDKILIHGDYRVFDERFREPNQL
jgi:hypothetical protein